MPDCPRCHQAVDVQAIACPHCHIALKAHGHPGITLYRAAGEEFLCQTCTYHEDDTCNFPQRPYARECTLYNNHLQPTIETIGYTTRRSFALSNWLRRNGGWLFLIGLVVISLAIALSKS